jgi:hypothetical protein
MRHQQLPTKAGIYFRKADDWDRKGWTASPNALLRDRDTPWDAKGAYGWIASHQQLVYKLSAEDLAAAGPRGRDHAYGMLRALEQRGWLTRQSYQSDDGRGTVQLWTLHGEPVPEEQRTFRPSHARRRVGKLSKTTPVDNPEPAGGADVRPSEPPADDPADDPASSQVSPGFLNVQESPNEDHDTERDRDDVSAGQPGIPTRAGVPGIPERAGTERAGTDRAGIPIEEEEKTKTEDHVVTSRRNVQTARASGRDDHTPQRRREPAPPATGHAEHAGSDDYRARRCPMCRLDVDGRTWIYALDVPGRPPYTPFTVCDHTTPLEAIQRDTAFREQYDADQARQTPPQPITLAGPINHGPRPAIRRSTRGTDTERDAARAELAAARARVEGTPDPMETVQAMEA